MSQPLMSLADSLASATVTGLCQGLILAMGVAAVLRCLRRSNAATRYAIAFMALLTVVALPCIHALRLDQGLGEPLNVRPTRINPGTSPLSLRKETPPLQVAPRERAVLTPLIPTDSKETLVPHHPIEAVPPEHSTLSFNGTNPLLGPNLLAQGLPTAVRPAPAEPPPTEKTAFTPSVWRWAAPRGLAAALLACWLGVAFIRLLRLAAQCLSLRRMRDQGQLPSAAMQAEFDRLRRAMGIRRSIEIRFIPNLPSPILVGWFRPTVLMPEALAQGKPSDWEPMLIHELAHVGRWDDWTNLVQQGLAAVFFFHPAVHWLSRRLAVEREIACDDHVLSAKGSPRSYALFLTEHARRMRGPDWVAAPAAWSNPSQLKERIHMLLDTQRNTSPRLARMRAGAWTSTVLLLAALGLYAAPRLTLAGTSHDTPEPPPQTPAPPTVTTTLRFTDETPTSPALPEPPQPPTFHHGMAALDERASLEHRLSHLERMVEQLLEGQNSGEGKIKWKGPSKNLEIEIERELAPLRDLQMQENHNLEVFIEKTHKQAQQLAAEAAHQARMEERQARRQADIIAQTEVARVTGPQRIVALQRRPLEEQRRNLQRQLSQLESQLERLEAELELLDEPTEKFNQESEVQSEGASIKKKTPHPDEEPVSADTQNRVSH
jgi:beta-lactamase regulating signal transducer with metallopeptidase domain